MTFIDEAWCLAFARQADADLKAAELYAQYPAAVSAECHRLMFLQMACEKLCKAHLMLGGADPETMQQSHSYTTTRLPGILREQMQRRGANGRIRRGELAQIRQIAREIELLNPSVVDGGRRPDNCEYPWRVAEKVDSPLDRTFSPPNLSSNPPVNVSGSCSVRQSTIC